MKRDYNFLRPSLSLLILIISFFLFQSNLHAQNARSFNKVVKGLVTDEKNIPFSSVNILIKGYTSGTVTDQYGKYSINANESSILIFPFIGVVQKEIAVNGQSGINVKLEEGNKILGDVVVVGYGTQKKINVIGPVVTINNKELTALPVLNIPI